MNRMTTTPGHHGGMPPPLHQQHHYHGGAGLARYGSAPGSFLAALADSVTRGGGGGEAPPQQQHQHQQQVGAGPAMSRFFSGESSELTSCESSCQTVDGGLQRAYGGSGEIHVPPPAPAHQVGLGGSLLRHSSSPAGLLSRLMSDPHGNGNGMGGSTRGMGSYSHAAAAGGGGNDAHRRLLSSQWSFSAQEMMPHISEMGVIPDIGESITGGGGGCNSSSDGGGGGCNSSSDGGGGLSRNFSMSSWDDTNSIIFSSPPGKKAKAGVVDGAAADGMVTSFSNIVDSQFGLSSSSLDMHGGGMDDYLQLQQDSVACRARAKRGCATHPRSIAERERRTRISKRLKRLQDLVPNMDKQTNTSDMLDIAVDYIKVLQEQIEKLKQEKANCSCSGSQN